ncbi:hypothetical protein M0R45_035969 [Rubus argutus]|uniref:Uncharacterized protein n=1 Tax=Rubus argutus TaxID=59490 RepID=A0AAW1VYW5_RUBAR
MVAGLSWARVWQGNGGCGRGTPEHKIGLGILDGVCGDARAWALVRLSRRRRRREGHGAGGAGSTTVMAEIDGCEERRWRVLAFEEKWCHGSGGEVALVIWLHGKACR